MEHSKEEIINALNVIQDVCSKHKNGCKYCPFVGIFGECLTYCSYPEDWRIKKEEESEIWRAFERD